MKTYEIRVRITEGNDEFWEGLKGPGVTEILQVVEEAVTSVMPDAEVKLTKFEDKE